MTITRSEAQRRSHTPEVLTDVQVDPDIFTDVDRSITYHRRNNITEPWNEWEWPRRLAALAIHHETTLRYKAGHVDPVTEAYEFVQNLKEQG